MFEVAKEARLTPNDIAKLLRVSRVTASLWFNKHNKPHHLIRARVERVLEAVKAGMEAGDFPIPHGTPRRERHLYVQRAIQKHLKEEPEQDLLSVS
jgi:hypothetical protein